MHYVLIELLCFLNTEYEFILFIVMYTLEGIITQKATLARSNFDSSRDTRVMSLSIPEMHLKMTDHATEVLLSYRKGMCCRYQAGCYTGMLLQSLL